MESTSKRAQADKIIHDFIWESRPLNIHIIKETGSPKLLVENLDLTTIHFILLTDLHTEDLGRSVAYNPEWDQKALLLRLLE